jgi:hypothetical protein
MMLLASADGNRVPVIAKLIQADEDFVIKTATTPPHQARPTVQPLQSGCSALNLATYLSK